MYLVIVYNPPHVLCEFRNCLVLIGTQNAALGCVGLGGRREPDQDTLSLRVARSGTNLPAPVAMPRQAVVC